MPRFPLSAAVLAALAFCVGCASDHVVAKDTVGAKSSEAAASPAQGMNQAPANFDEELQRAQALRLEGNYPEATRALAQLMLAAPDDARVVGEYGKALAQQGRSDDAIAFLKRATDLNNSDWTLYSALGVAYDQNDDHKSARAAYRRALTLKPGEPAVLNNYAVSLMLTGDLDGARRMLASMTVAASNPKIASNSSLLAQLEAKKSTPVAAPAAKAAAPAVVPAAKSLVTTVATPTPKASALPTTVAVQKPKAEAPAAAATVQTPKVSAPAATVSVQKPKPEMPAPATVTATQSPKASTPPVAIAVQKPKTEAPVTVAAVPSPKASPPATAVANQTPKATAVVVQTPKISSPTVTGVSPKVSAPPAAVAEQVAKPQAAVAKTATASSPRAPAAATTKKTNAADVSSRVATAAPKEIVPAVSSATVTYDVPSKTSAARSAAQSGAQPVAVAAKAAPSARASNAPSVTGGVMMQRVPVDRLAGRVAKRANPKPAVPSATEPVTQIAKSTSPGQIGDAPALRTDD